MQTREGTCRNIRMSFFQKKMMWVEIDPGGSREGSTMKRLKNIFRMRTKILAFCLAITLSALTLQTFLYRNTSSTLIYQQAKEENLRILENMQTEVNSYLETVESNLIRLYNESDFIQDLQKNVPVEELKDKYYRLAFQLGNDEFDSATGVVATYLYTDEHEIISTYRRATTPKHNYPTDIYSGTHDANAEAVKEYVESDSKEMLISSYYNTYRETDLARFVMKLYYNGNISRMIGYVVCDVDTKVLRYLMNKYTAGGESYVWLQPSGDRAITATGTLPEEELPYYEAANERVRSGEAEKSQVLEQQGHVFFGMQNTKYNMGCYALMQRSLLEKNQKTLNRSLLLIGIGMCLAAALFCVPLSKGLTRQLERMTRTMERIKGGETELRMDNLNRDEIGELGRTFNEMLDQIEGLIAREYEAQLMTNRAEYNALQAQINPHFLYNTLDTMSSIAQIQDCPQVSALSQSLSNIFRYSLDMRNPFSTVAKEIVHLKNYIYVMNVRMPEEISYQFEIKDEVLQDTLPRISIQPLVENAINHGLKNARGEKHVVIRAYTEGENLKITVEDNGVGISPERMAELLTQQSEQGTSIGLSNIHSRMKMLYGEAYGVTIESEEGCGTRVQLTIPRRKMEEVELWKGKSTKS